MKDKGTLSPAYVAVVPVGGWCQLPSDGSVPAGLIAKAATEVGCLGVPSKVSLCLLATLLERDGRRQLKGGRGEGKWFRPPGRSPKCLGVLKKFLTDFAANVAACPTLHDQRTK